MSEIHVVQAFVCIMIVRVEHRRMDLKIYVHLDLLGFIRREIVNPIMNVIKTGLLVLYICAERVLCLTSRVKAV